MTVGGSTGTSEGVMSSSYMGKLHIHSLNFGVITLLPKITDATRIQQYRPICLLNVSFKVFTKVLNNRILKVADKLIGPSQTAFILGRYNGRCCNTA